MPAVRPAKKIRGPEPPCRTKLQESPNSWEEDATRVGCNVELGAADRDPAERPGLQPAGGIYIASRAESSDRAGHTGTDVVGIPVNAIGARHHTGAEDTPGGR